MTFFIIFLHKVKVYGNIKTQKGGINEMKMSDTIKNLRVESGLTQEELANKLGLQKSAIAKYESGKVENIKRSIIQEMANIFSVSPSELMGWGEEEKTADILVEITENKDLQILVERAMKLSSKNLEQLLKYSEFLSNTGKEND